MFIKKYSEQVIWATALLWLFFMDTSSPNGSCCIFKIAGFRSCLGCGIGHSVHYALHLDPERAFSAHIMGIPATLVMLWQIFKPFFKNKTLNYHGPTTANAAKRNTA